MIKNIYEEFNFVFIKRKLLDISFLDGKYSKFGPPHFYYEFRLLFPMIIEDINFKGNCLFFFLTDRQKEKRNISILFENRSSYSSKKEKNSFINFTFKKEEDSFSYKDLYLNGDVYIHFDKYDEIFNNIKEDFCSDYKITEKSFLENVTNCKNKSLANSLYSGSICSGLNKEIILEVFYKLKLTLSIKCNKLTEDEIKDLYKELSKIAIDVNYKFSHENMEKFNWRK